MYLVQKWTSRNTYRPQNLFHTYGFDFRDFESMDNWKELNTTILEG